MVLTISKEKAVLWAQFAHWHMQTFSWEYLKNCTFTPTLKIFQHFTVIYRQYIFLMEWNGI